MNPTRRSASSAARGCMRSSTVQSRSTNCPRPTVRRPTRSRWPVRRPPGGVPAAARTRPPIPAAQDPYRANLWALRSLGVRQIVAPVRGRRAAAGTRAGHLRGPRSAVDRTCGRPSDVLQRRRRHRVVRRPVLPGRATRRSRSTADMTRWTAARWSSSRDRGSRPGPSRGGIGQDRRLGRQHDRHPEAILARELGLCYTSIALVTDLDAGVKAGTSVTQEEVFGCSRRTPSG